MTDLSTLLSRVESGSGADWPLQQDLWAALDIQGWFPPDLLTDLNAVVALVEARLPGKPWGVRVDEPWASAWVGPNWTASRAIKEPARAPLAALIRAEMENVK